MSYPILHSWSRTGVIGTCGFALQLWTAEATESSTDQHALGPCVRLQPTDPPDLPFSTSVTKSFLTLPTWCASHSSRSNSRILCFMKPCGQSVCVPPKFLCWTLDVLCRTFGRCLGGDGGACRNGTGAFIKKGHSPFYHVRTHWEGTSYKLGRRVSPNLTMLIPSSWTSGLQNCEK